MADIEAECNLWTKAENAAGLITPEIGPAGNINGVPTHEAAKFNNGFLAAVNTNYVAYNNALVIPNYNRFIFECWLKFKVGSAAWNYNEGICNNRQFAAAHGISCFMKSTDQLSVYVKDAGIDLELINDLQAWAANDKVHFLLIADNTASFDGAKTLAVYWNEIETASTVQAFNITAPLANFNIGNLWASITYGNLHMIIDNPKIYGPGGIPLLADIIANKDNENFPVLGRLVANKYNFQEYGRLTCH